jgi:hypothetical protein
MAQRVYWLLENRVMVGELSGVVTLEDIKANNAAMEALGQHCPPNLHLITLTDQISKNQISLKDLQTLAKSGSTDTKFIWRLTVSNNHLYRLFAGLAAQFFSHELSKGNTKQFATLAEALQFLQEVDNSLPPLLPLAQALLELQEPFS